MKVNLLPRMFRSQSVNLALPVARVGLWTWLIRGLLLTVAAAWLLLGLGLWWLHGWIVPRIEQYRPQLEQQASQALGTPVRIGNITVQTGGLIPSFVLRDVSLLDAQGRQALRLPRVVGAFSLSSLWGLGFEQLLIESPELDIRRTADGKLYVGGLEITQTQAIRQSPIADWLFSQTEWVVRGGTLRWTDEQSQAPMLALTQVEAVLRNGRLTHQIRIDATPPAEWGARFNVQAVFKQAFLSRHAGDFSQWRGQAFADFQRVDASHLHQYVNFKALGLELSQGHGALRLWADMAQGQFTGGTADVALSDVQARLGRKLEPLALDWVVGRIGGGQRSTGFDFNTQALRFRMRDGLAWPGGNVTLVHHYAQTDTVQRTELNADKLDLAALALIAKRLPLDAVTHGWIDSFAPQGVVQSLQARWQGPLQTPTRYTAKGQVLGLRVAALPALASSAVPVGHKLGRPGIAGANIDFDLSEVGGRLKLVLDRGALDFPGVFELPVIAVDKLETDAQWTVAKGKTTLELRGLQFSNADMQGQAQLSWQGGAGPADPGHLDLQGSLVRANGAQVHRYLPLVLPESARHYVRDAVVQGQLSEVGFKVKGALNQLPFKAPNQGDFKISAKLRNGQFSYVPQSIAPPDMAPWPTLTNVEGELLFDRQAMEVNKVSAQVAAWPKLQVLKAQARIPDLSQKATVEVNADLKGPLADALAFVNTSPLAGMTGHALEKASATGLADYRLRLVLPLHAIAQSQLDGTITLAGNDLRWSDSTPLLSKIKATVNITERGFALSGAQASFLGGDVRLEGSMRSVAGKPESRVTSLKAQGSVSAEGLRQAKELGLLARMAQSASGSTAYTASLLLRRGTPEVTISSSLQGMALSLPAPLNKAAETALPLHLESALLPASLEAGQALQDQLSMSLGRLAKLTYVRDLSGTVPRVLRGSLAVGLAPDEAAPSPDSGVAANIHMTQLDLDAWDKVLTDATAATSAVAPTDALAYLPSVLAIRADELTLQGRKLKQVVVGGSREDLTWRANVDAQELNGYVEFRQPSSAGAGRVYARLSRLNLAPAAAKEVEALLNEQPASIPALDIVVDALELRGKQLGRVEIEAVNRRTGVPAGEAFREASREWRLNKFNVILPEATLTATGNWVALNAQTEASTAPIKRRTVMNFALDVKDSGELLKRFGMADVVRGGEGKLKGQVAWLGSPLNLDYPSLSGQFNVAIGKGQFVKADPGIAKLLGVLSLQALPRRLALDFRDVFSEGFAFDLVDGDVTITQGVAATNNLRMRGVNAAVLMEGSADIARETQNIKVVVVPEINAGTLSLITTVINPAIGVGSFLAQMFLRRPLMQAATQEFHIDGKWADPHITKVDRKAAHANPGLSAPASAASAPELP